MISGNNHAGQSCPASDPGGFSNVATSPTFLSWWRFRNLSSQHRRAHCQLSASCCGLLSLVGRPEGNSLLLTGGGPPGLLRTMLKLPHGNPA